MSERNARILSTIVLATLLGASILAVTPAGGFPVNAAQNGLTQDFFGSGAPHMAWTPRATTNEFYIHSDPTSTGVGSTNAVPWTNGPDLTGAVLDATVPMTEAVIPYTVADGMDGGDYGEQALISCIPANNNDCLGGVIGAARFPLADSLAITDPIQIYRFAGDVWAGCSSSTGSLPGGLDGNAAVPAGLSLRLIRQVKDANGAWIDDPSVGSVGNANVGVIANALLEAVPVAGVQVGLYSGSTPVGDQTRGTGPLVSPGQRLLVQVEVDASLNVDDHCVIYYNRDFCEFSLCLWGGHSRVQITSNAERFALFPANGKGNLATGFPSASSTDAANRRFNIEALVATAFGPDEAFMEQLKGKHANVRIYDATNEKYLYYVDKYSGNAFPRDIDIQEIQLLSDRADDASPQPDIENHIGQGILRRSFLFQYPATLPDIPRVEPQFYSYSDSWDLKGPQFAIGGKGITFQIASFDTSLHTINPGEPTEFSFLLRNIGTADDLVAVSVSDPGEGWMARILGGGAYFLRPGGVALGTVEVVPSANAVAGADKTIVVRAASSHAEVTDPDPISFRTVLSNTVTHKVDISSVATSFQVNPGTPKSFPVTLINQGTRRDSFVVIPSFPSTVQGWTVTATPASLQIPAGGMAQVLVSVSAPPEAPTGMSFPLGLSAVQVGNSAISDRIDVTVDVFYNVGFVLGILDPGVERRIREDAPDACINSSDLTCGFDDGTPAQGTLGTLAPDTVFDRSAMFRIPFTNNGDLPESFRVEAVWDKTVAGTKDTNGCDGDPNNRQSDGIPDGWRYRWWTDLGNPMPAGRQFNGIGAQDSAGGGFAGRYQLNDTSNPLVVPPRSTVFAYLEIGNVGSYTCQRSFVVVSASVPILDAHDVNSVDSPVGAMKVTATSIRDPALRQTVSAITGIDPAGTFIRTNEFSGATHNVGVEAVGSVSRAVSEAQSAVFDVIATNKANEKDGMKISVAGSPGWATHVVATRTVPESIPCDIPAADRSITCSNLGVYDDVHLQVVATPNPGVQVGDVNHITVIVQSTDKPGIVRTLQLTARLAGEFDFDLLPRGATTRPVVAGQTVSFPFVVGNAGTADDSYRFSLLTGSPVWQPVLSSSAPVFVPAGFQMPALLTVTAPVGSAQAFSDTFRIKVESVESGTIKTFEVTPVVQPASGLLVFGKDGQDVLIAKRNTDTEVTVRAVQVSGTFASQATFTPDLASLPPGWDVNPKTPVTVSLTPDSSDRPTGEAVFKVKAPANALGSGQGLLRVTAATVGTSPLTAATDLRLNLASTFGIGLNVTQAGGEKQVIAPGGPAIFNLTVQNLGLGSDVVSLSSTQAPAGWTVLFNPGTMSLGPLQKRTVEVKVTAPVSAQPADIASLVVFATSTSSPTDIASIPLQAQVGFHALQLEVVTQGIRRAAPQETNVWVLNLTNNGTLPDEVRISGVVDTKALSSFLTGVVEPAGSILLAPNQTVQIRLLQTYAADIPSNATVQGRLLATSFLDARATPATASATLTSQALPYVAIDANRDRIVEYFVDRDLDASNGFEEFLPTKTPGGRPLASADLERFLRDDARDSFSRDVTLANGTVVRIVDYVIDGDNDGKVDHFLDADGDDLPDGYCDPDAAKCSNIDFRKDVNGDQVPEFFVDTDGDGAVNAVFDLTRGTFTRVLHVDVDGDGVLDYVVDKNGNGRVDQDETVLYTRTGHLLIVQKVDVDGDGRLDQVFDTDGNGAPDYFIPAASTASIAIVMQDMTGDGVQDWTYDGDNDGRRESYYDPVTGKAHVIDAAGHFGDALKRYWYIGVLFALVVGLFVTLVLVTRR